MDENTELEEGEACHYKDGDDNNDLDSLSYIVRVLLDFNLNQVQVFLFEFGLVSLLV